MATFERKENVPPAGWRQTEGTMRAGLHSPASQTHHSADGQALASNAPPVIFGDRESGGIPFRDAAGGSREPHDGGWHGRYVLRSGVRIVEDAR